MCVYSSLLTIFLNAYMNYFLIGVSHNYSHQRSYWKYAMDFTFFPHKDFIISHCMSHHTFPNL
jgi:hypothetical protein